MGDSGLPTWRLLVDAARSLDPTGSTPFRSRDLIARVQVIDATRQSGSITPILQGMTANASGGPKSACGEVFWRVDRGVYRFRDANAPQRPLRNDPASLPVMQVRAEPPPLPHTITNKADADFEQTGIVVLLGCVSSKRATPARAKDLYISALFNKRRAYAEQSGNPWFILSAEHGLIHPEQPIAPYDRSLLNESRGYVADWAAKVAELVVAATREAGANVVEVHAGSAYLPTSLRQALEASNIRVDHPVEGLRIGEHLAWYSHQPSPSQPASRKPPPVERDTGRPTEQPTDDQTRQAIAKRLATETDSVAGLLIPLADDPAADDFIKRDAFAFLVAVIADYQVKAEWAWRLPYDLAARLGGLTPARIVLHADETIRAFRSPSPLHRFPDQTARWIVEAAERVMDRYEGEAANIWNDTPTATELQRRLEAFKGISQKKAAMAVEILERIIGVEIGELGGSDIAYDVHVRRVFLRSGLAANDDVRAMVQAARELWPERPGSLDAAAWHIGRTWCRPTDPLCDDCLLADLCPRLISAANGVRGA